MSDLERQEADLSTHHIEGVARAAVECGKSGGFRVDLISHVEGNLWQGGCVNGARLTDDFEFVVSLYPWEQYTIGSRTTRIELKLYDCGEIPDERQLYDLARIVNAFRAAGKTLVHCQAGLNRSGLICALALIEDGMAPADAIALLREKRCEFVLCNETFERWLLERVFQEAAA